MTNQKEFVATTLSLALLLGAGLVSAEPAVGSAALSDSPAPALKLLGRWYRGPVYSSAVSGNHVFFGSGGAIRVLQRRDGFQAGHS